MEAMYRLCRSARSKSATAREQCPSRHVKVECSDEKAMSWHRDIARIVGVVWFMSIPERRKRERVAVSFGATGTAKLKGSGSMLLTIPSGTAVLIQKQGICSAQFKHYVTQEEISVSHSSKDTPKAVLILYRGYKIWVSKKFVHWRYE